MANVNTDSLEMIKDNAKSVIFHVVHAMECGLMTAKLVVNTKEK
jgi:hypothetical protein